MDNRIQNGTIQDLLVRSSQTPKPASKADSSTAFAEILADRLKVSGHAQTRLQSRNIQMGPSEWDRVMSGVDRAAQKGAKESLVLMDDVALVVSVKNRTVITAVDKAQLKENVFTNIDSAVIV
jgi:flagellar operon protein